MLETCGTCGYFGSESVTSDIGGVEAKFDVPVCRRHPPEFNSDSAAWSIVRPESDWCGDHSLYETERCRAEMAGHVLAGMLGNPDAFQSIIETAQRTQERPDACAANIASAYTDAMLKRLAKTYENTGDVDEKKEEEANGGEATH